MSSGNPVGTSFCTWPAIVPPVRLVGSALAQDHQDGLRLKGDTLGAGRATTTIRLPFSRVTASMIDRAKIPALHRLADAESNGALGHFVENQCDISWLFFSLQCEGWALGFGGLPQRRDVWRRRLRRPRGGGGRRDAEKSGRSRVTESESMGIRERGLPGGGCRRPGFSTLVSCGSAVGPVSFDRPRPAASWPRAMHAEKVVIAAIAQAQRPPSSVYRCPGFKRGVSPCRFFAPAPIFRQDILAQVSGRGLPLREQARVSRGPN